MEFVAVIIIVFAVVAIQNGVYNRYGLKDLEYTCYFSTDEAYEGDNIELVEVITNKKWLPLPWLKTEITTSKWLDFAGSQSLVTDETRFVPSFFMLKSYHKVVRKWNVKCLKRGMFSISRVVVVTTDLLGNVSLSLPVTVDSKITILPKPAALEQITLSPKHMSGDVIVKRHLIADPFYFAGVREYTQRDPVNKIHWFATAKAQRIMVHNNEYTSTQSLTVVLNMQSREFENFEVIDKENMENAIRVCAACFDSTIASGIPVRFVTNASVSEKREAVVTNEYWGAQHVLDLLRILAGLRLISTEVFSLFLNENFNHLVSTDIIIVSGYLSDSILEFARNKQYCGIHVKILLVADVNEEDVPEDCDIYCLAALFRNEGDTDER